MEIAPLLTHVSATLDGQESLVLKVIPFMMLFYSRFSVIISLSIAICLNVTCVNGQCMAPETCTCSGNWAGANCTSCAAGWEAKNCLTPICSAGCDHGTCKAPSTCDCLSHWTGNLCNFCDDGWEDTDCNTGSNTFGSL
jgi:hypothetical protein